MNYEKKLNGIFEPVFPNTAQQFSEYLVTHDFDFSCKTPKDGAAKFTVKFVDDDEYNQTLQAILKMEDSNNPQMSLELNE